jgi:Tfp pilus assembly pilus retraction ATPase PilT
MIRGNSLAQIKSAIQTGAKEGMVTMENYVKQLLKDKLITQEVAKKRLEE